MIRKLLAILCVVLLAGVAPAPAQTPMLTLPQLGVDRATSPNGPWTLYLRGLNGTQVPLGSVDPLGGKFAVSLGYQAVSHVANAAALVSPFAPATTLVIRDDVGVLFVNSAPPCSAPDGITQVPTSAGASCLVIVPPAGGVSQYVFGAKCDSNGQTGNGTDDSAAIQSWANYGQTSGLRLKLAGKRGSICRTTQPITVSSASLNVIGDYCQPGTIGGSTLYFDHLGQGINFSTGQSVLESICTRRTQPNPVSVTTTATMTVGNTGFNVLSAAGMNQYDPISGANIPTGAYISLIQGNTVYINTPLFGSGSGVTVTAQDFTPAPADFDIYTSADLDIRHVILSDPTKGLYSNLGRTWIDDLKGQPLSVGIQNYANLDTMKWNNIHFWPYTLPVQYVYSWQYRNLVSLHLYRADNMMLTNFSSIIQATCIQLSSNPNSAAPYQGAANKLRLDGGDCDGIGNGYGIQVDSSVGPASAGGAGGVVTANFVNFTTQSSNAPGQAYYNSGALEVDGNGSTLGFDGFQSTFMSCNGAVVGGTGNTVTFHRRFMQDWGMQSTTCPALSAALGNIVVDASPAIYDTALNPGDTTFYGGSRYQLAAASSAPLPPGSGNVSVTDQATKATALVLLGAQSAAVIGQAGTEFAAVASGTDAAIAAATPSGKVGVAYSTTRSAYVLYNNLGAALSYNFSQNSLSPLN